MKAITFLGVTPKDAVYTMDGRDHEANHFGIALARFIPNLKVRALVTQKAFAEQYSDFESQVEDYVADVKAVLIPDGKDTDELWQLFERVIENIDDDEDVVFDITHGFRSLPFLSFLAAAYVRIVKRAQIKGVYYANWEAGSGSPRKVPVIDLTEFVPLLDWMMAADLFSRRGDSGRLAGLMRTNLRDLTPAQRDLHRKSSSSKIVTSMENVSKSLRLIRPNEVMEASAQLINRLQEGVGELAQSARPFVPLLEQVADAYRPLALAEPDTDPVASLKIERDLVHWYLDRGYLVQATAVAREWLVTWGLLQLGETKIRDRTRRTEMEAAITSQLPRHREQPRETCMDISQMPNAVDLAVLYDQLGRVRNDLLHAGKNSQPLPRDTMEANIRKYCGQLADFSIPEPKHPTP